MGKRQAALSSNKEMCESAVQTKKLRVISPTSNNYVFTSDEAKLVECHTSYNNDESYIPSHLPRKFAKYICLLFFGAKS